jgi:endonuclease YncB( thermonuclease family)
MGSVFSICCGGQDDKKQKQRPQQQVEQQPKKDDTKKEPIAADNDADASGGDDDDEQPGEFAERGFVAGGVKNKRKNNNKKPEQQPQHAPTIVASSSSTAVPAPHTKPLAGFEVKREVVHSVYDADTVNLKGEARDRVRFAGIDAPELKAAEFMAAEGADFLKKLLTKKEVVLEIDSNNRQDHYGRIVARVFTHVDEYGGVVCVNDVLLLKGFVSFYDPSGLPAALREHLLALQAYAIKQRDGIWSRFDGGAKVVRTRNGGSYHNRSCEHVASIRQLTEVTKAEAVASGLSACRTCHA